MKFIRLHNGMRTMVDNADFNRFSKFHWTAVKKKTGIYAMRQVELPKLHGKRRSRKIYLHRAICGEPAAEVHHKDDNTLNNRRKNLQPLTATEHRHRRGKPHRQTSSRYIGVSWWRNARCWAAQLSRNGKRLLYSAHKTQRAAARAYDKFAKTLNDGARLNFT